MTQTPQDTPVFRDDTMMVIQHTMDTLTCNGSCDTLRKGEHDAHYGAKENGILDRRADCRRVERARNNGALLDTKETLDCLQVWPSLESQKERSGDVYRKQQNRQGVNYSSKNVIGPSRPVSLIDGP